MFDDARIVAGVRNGLMSVAVPPIDLVAIQRRTSARRDPRPTRPRRVLVALASAAALVAGLSITAAQSPALLQSVRDRYIAALHAAGIGSAAHEPVPERIRRLADPVPVTLAQAQRQANFRVIAPAGLPADVVSRAIFAAPLAVWSEQRDAWSTDGVQITFAYRRSNGRAFDIIAVRYTSLSLPVPHYIYDVDDVPPDGKPNLRYRRENVVWRTGDEALHVVASPAISSREIGHVRAAMHGIPLARYDNPFKKPAMRTERFAIPR